MEGYADDAAKTADAMRDGLVEEAIRPHLTDRFADMLRAVIQASDDFARLSDPADRAFFLTESSPTGSRRWDALIAGLAVHLCRVGQMETAPMWTTDPSFTLHDMWFVDSDAPTMRAQLMQQAIPSMRARGVIVSRRNLESV